MDQKTLTEDLKSQQDIKACTNPQSLIRKSNRNEKSKIKLVEIEIDEEKSMKEPDIFEVANILNEGSRASKFQTQLSVTKRGVKK